MLFAPNTFDFRVIHQNGCYLSVASAECPFYNSTSPSNRQRYIQITTNGHVVVGHPCYFYSISYLHSSFSIKREPTQCASPQCSIFNSQFSIIITAPAPRRCCHRRCCRRCCRQSYHLVPVRRRWGWPCRLPPS